ncbi:MAG: hypothetical protein KAX49_14060 [Halanaerobiales bacterium]|nr:hypothetical protein [Halanaerobiales bacterium]
MNIKEAKEKIKKLYELRIAFMLWGSTGVGKSAIVKEVTEELGIQLVNKSLLTLETPDLEGYPFPDFDKGIVKQLPPEWATYPENFNGIMLFDEFNHASDDLQKAFYSVFYDHKIGDVLLPEGLVVCGTGNKREHGARVIDMEIPLEARIHEMEIEPDADAWREWALTHNIDKDIIAYIYSHPDSLYVYPETRNEKVTCGRGWERVSKLLSKKLDSIEDLSGSIGLSVGAEFITFRELSKCIPSIDAILLGKDDVKIPDRFDILSYTIQSVIQRIKIEKTKQKQLKSSKGYFKYVRRIWEMGMASSQHASFVEASAAFTKDFKVVFPTIFSQMFSDSNFKKVMSGIGKEILD